MYEIPEAVVGIDPKTKHCEVVGKATDDTYAEIRQCGFIAVPVTLEQARNIFGLRIPDIYNIVSPNAGAKRHE